VSDTDEIPWAEIEKNLAPTDNPLREPPPVPEGVDPGPYPNDWSESWTHGRIWPFNDADGDPVDTAAGMAALYPEVDLRKALRLPIGAAMPEKLKAEVRGWGDDPDFNLDGTAKQQA
jgi:hypothetical protein